MNKPLASKPEGNGEPAHVDQPKAGLSRKQSQPCTPPLDQDQQQRIRELLSRRQVAERWSCCEHTVARRKDLKPLRFNQRLLRYRLEDVEAVERAATLE